MSKKLLSAAVFFIAVLFLNIDLSAEAVFSGNINTIDPRSGFNSLRNPALMSMKRWDEVSFLYSYSYLAGSDTDSDISITGNQYDSKMEIDEDFNGALYFSTVQHSGRSAFGLGISRGGDGQLRFSSTDLAIKSDALSMTYKETRRDIGSTLMLSYSYRISSRKSLGLQVENSLSIADLEKESISFSGGSVYEEKRIDMEQRRVTSGISLGYYYTGTGVEVGTMLKSGRFGFENRKYKYEEKVTMSSNDSDIPDYYMHDEGAGLVAGLGLKPSRTFSVAFEAGAAVPYSYDIRECSEDSSALTEYKSEVDIKYALTFKGGVNWRITPAFTLGGGAGYVGYRAETGSNFNNSESTQRFDLYNAMAGADWRISRGINIFAGLNFTFTTARLENENSLMSMEVSENQYGIDFMCGVTSSY